MSKMAIITDHRYLDHDTGGGDHPEVPARLQVIRDRLRASACFPALEFHPPAPAPRHRLLAAHDEAWLFRFEEAALSGRTYIDHSDNQIGYDSYEVAVLAAGAGLAAIDLLEQGAVSRALCLVRPPGHHAERKMPFGFCFFNNCVIAARYWQEQYGLKRIVVFDFDAHHGNGIQSAFEREADSCYVSIHEHPSFSYPGTGYADEVGLEAGRGTILNLPLLPGGSDRDVVKLLEGRIAEALERWQPEALIVAAGFDAHEQDTMSGLSYSTALYRHLGLQIRNWSEQYCPGRLLSILEGGYDLESLAASVEAYVQGLQRLDDSGQRCKR